MGERESGGNDERRWVAHCERISEEVNAGDRGVEIGDKLLDDFFVSEIREGVY